jgi:hypothetical protein
MYRKLRGGHKENRAGLIFLAINIVIFENNEQRRQKCQKRSY